MGTRWHYAFCEDCRDKCQKKTHHGEFWDKDGSFGFVWEHMSKQDAIQHLKETVCPCCHSENWTLSDYSEI